MSYLTLDIGDRVWFYDDDGNLSQGTIDLTYKTPWNQTYASIVDNLDSDNVCERPVYSLQLVERNRENA